MPQEFTGDLTGSRFAHADLSGSRITASDLSGVVMRGVDIDGADIDAPWLLGDATLLVNGVDVVAFVESELNKRFLGRELARASDPPGLRAAWAALEAAWSAAVRRASAMPDGTIDTQVDGEWSFAQTVRHLIMATDMWLGRGILEREQPFHPLGQPHASFERDDDDGALFTADTPPFDEVLKARADRVRLVRDYIAETTPDQLSEARKNPHAPEYPETVLSCLHVILEEEWAHLRFALRDLDVIEARAT